MVAAEVVEHHVPRHVLAAQPWTVQPAGSWCHAGMPRPFEHTYPRDTGWSASPRTRSTRSSSTVTTMPHAAAQILQYERWSTATGRPYAAVSSVTVPDGGRAALLAHVLTDQTAALTDPPVSRRHQNPLLGCPPRDT